jgi:parallel beta-helix repeat protein
MLNEDYNAEEHHASIHNSFPILCANQTEGVVIENLTVDGNKTENAYMDGCRGGAFYLYRTNNAIIRNCVARNYNGDGISFQITDNIRLINCESHDNVGYGVHPGAGTAHCTVKGCRIHDNGKVGLFLCWRVQNGRVEDNRIENNGQYGISIGHKDSDNVFVNNTIAGNGISGVYFRKETFNNSGHRNTFIGNKVLNNGSAREGYGFFIEPKAGDIVLSKNRITDTRSGKNRTQRYGVYKTAGVGNVVVAGNDLDGNVEKDVFERQ